MVQKTLAKRNWAAVDRAGQARGAEIVIAFFKTQEPPPRMPRYAGRGCTPIYADDTIEALLVLRSALQLPLRAVEGLARQMRDRVGGAWPVPDHTTLSRRMARLDISLARATGEKLILMVDSTGLKVVGEGEWRRRKFGVGQPRVWAKAHVAVERRSGKVVNVVLTDNTTNDCEVFAELLKNVPLEGGYVLGDGAYHTKNCHRAVHQRGGRLLSPPRVDAAAWPNEPAFRWRNSQRRIRNHIGDKAWRLASGYSRRSYAETMMHRLKALTGPRMASRQTANQVVELRLRAAWLNRCVEAAAGSQTNAVRAIA